MSVVPWSTKGSKDTIDDTDELMLFVPSEPITADKNQTITGTNIQVYTENTTLHTGVRRGLALSVASATTFNVAAGDAIIVNRDPNPLLTTVTKISKAEELGILDTNLGENLSHIFMDAAGIITVETERPQNLSDIFNKIYLGAVIPFGGVIGNIIPDPIVAHGSSATELAELVFAGGTTLSGSLLTGNSDLTLDVTPGLLRQSGRGFTINANSPNEIETPAFTPIPQSEFFLVYIDSGGDIVIDNSSNELDPTQINTDGLGTLNAISPANNFSIIRVFQAGDNNDFLFYYGTEEFGTIADAVAAIEPTWVESENTRDISPIAKIFIRADVTDIAAGVAAGTVIIQAITSRTQL